MPSTWKTAHSISGPELDALRAGGTAPRVPTSRPARGVNAWMLMDGGRLWLGVLVLSVLVVAVAAFGAWRTMREPVARYAPPVEAAPAVAPVAAVPALATSPVPTATPVQLYAAAPTLTLYCDGQRVEMTSAKQAAARYRAGCVAAYGWCEACQIAWYGANP